MEKPRGLSQGQSTSVETCSGVYTMSSGDGSIDPPLLQQSSRLATTSPVYAKQTLSNRTFVNVAERGDRAGHSRGPAPNCVGRPPRPSSGHASPPSCSAVFRARLGFRPHETPPLSPPLPYQQDVTRAAEESDGSGGSDRYSVMPAETRRTKWVLFVVGNLLSVAIVISEIASLSVCFDEYLGDDPEETTEENASSTYIEVMMTLVFGLWVDVASAVGLVLIYRAPLDIKSVHKIPPEDRRHLGGNLIVHFLAPFSWAFTYLVGGAASISYAQNSSCGGQGGAGLERYLYISGGLTVMGGLLLFAISLVTLFVACGTPASCMDGCCTRARRVSHRGVLSAGPFLDLWWQLQSIVWSYRTGAFGLVESILLGLTGVAGQVLAALGSFAPDVVRELVRPVNQSV